MYTSVSDNSIDIMHVSFRNACVLFSCCKEVQIKLATSHIQDRKLQLLSYESGLAVK